MSRKRLSTHIPDPSTALTYCGLPKSRVETINTRADMATFLPGRVEDCIDDATCRNCGRSDDRRVRQEAVRFSREKEAL